jgi:hypothetical protein
MSESALAKYAPDAQFRAGVSVRVNAPPEAVMRALHVVRLRDMPLARALGELRYLPGRLLGKPRPAAGQEAPFIQMLLESGTLVLERTATTLITGSAGKYHQIADQQPMRFGSPAELLSFENPDYQKLFMSIRAEPQGAGASRLILEHWTLALSERSRRSFARYWIAIRPLGNFVSWLMLRAGKRIAERQHSGGLPGPTAS